MKTKNENSKLEFEIRQDVEGVLQDAGGLFVDDVVDIVCSLNHNYHPDQVRKIVEKYF